MNLNCFVEIIKSIKDYWIKESQKNNLSIEEVADGICFTILSTIDGSTQKTDFKQILLSTKDNKKFNKNDFLHEIYCALCKSEGDK